MDLLMRPETDDDVEFLYRLYRTTREHELAFTQWDDTQKEAFVSMQFNAQRDHYRRHYPNASFQVILFEAQTIGRLYVDRWENEIRIMDIALMPEFCGQGLGSQLLGEILEEGQRTGKPVTIHVEKYNPARRLYQRLGFELVEDKEIYHFMRWTPR